MLIISEIILISFYFDTSTINGFMSKYMTLIAVTIKQIEIPILEEL